MEGYFETIENGGDGIVGSAAGLFQFLSQVVQKNFFFTFLSFLQHNFHIAQVSVDFSAFFWTAWL